MILNPTSTPPLKMEGSVKRLISVRQNSIFILLKVPPFLKAGVEVGLFLTKDVKKY
jgi:hypothetical protein